MTKQHWSAVVVCMMLTAGAQPRAGAQPIPDEPFRQEYRDPFVLGEEPAENDVRAIAVDSDGRVWTATAAGVRLVEAGTLIEPPGDRIGGPAYDVSVAADGTVWAGAWNGVYRVRAGALERIPGRDGPVTVVAPLGGRLFSGNAQGIGELVGGKWTPVPGPWATCVRAIALVDGRLCVASWSGLYLGEDRELTRVARPDQPLSRNTSALAVDPKGQLWIGSRGGIDVYRGDRRIRSITGREGLPSTDVRALAFDGAGVLWVGTDLGVARFDGTRWSLRHSLRWLPHDEVRDVAFAGDGAAWIATRGGISTIRGRMMTLADKAAYYQRLVRQRHVRPPGLVEKCRLRTAGDITTWEPMDTDNDGLFTGLYLVGEACRYAVTGAADAKANATEAYRAMEYLQTVTETPGFVARTVVPADWTQMADANRGHTPTEVAEQHARDARWKPVEKRWRTSADGKWLWKGDTSSDEITGHFFAYSVYYDLVADDEEKARVAHHVRRIIDYIVDGGYVLRDIDGNATRWAIWSPEKLNGDPNWWLERGGNSVEILSYLTVARHVTGDEQYDREIARLLDQHNYAENILTPMQANADFFTYIGFQLQAMAYPALLAYEQDPRRRNLYQKSLEHWFAPVRKDASPLYGFVYGAASDGDFRQHECVELLRDVPLDMVQWTVDNTRRQDVKLVERPVEGVLQTERLLPPSERSIFRWDRNVYEALGGDGGRVESSSVFWLTPYWLGRYHGFIGGPRQE